jgi:ubiquinone/menaquinone biosynthesis C-methylase UbiE
MIDEIYRVLAPGGRYITFSLHDVNEILGKYSDKKYNWSVTAHRVKSNRWNAGEHCRRAVAHSMLICVKHHVAAAATTSATVDPLPSLESHVLTDEEFKHLQEKANLVRSIMISA